MSKIHSKCPKCNKVVRAGVEGSMTQWVLGCYCDSSDQVEQFQPSPVVEVCKNCGGSRESVNRGTITGFIFRKSICSCPRPVFEKRLTRRTVTASTFFENDVDQEPASSEQSMESLRSFPSDRYTPIRRLGKGGFSEVFLCMDRKLNRQVAMKTLRAIDSNSLVAFQNEARATALLSHPNIVSVLDFGIEGDSLPYMVLEPVKGISLEHYLQDRGPLPSDIALPIFIEIAEGLSFAHQRGVFHRDLKPGNVLLTVDESESTKVKIIDFGLAAVNFEAADRDAQGKTMVGTPCYMAPERLEARPFDARSEIYSMGCLMYEVLCGKPPFDAGTAMATLSMHIVEPVPALSERAPFKVPAELESLIRDRCLAKDSSDRPDNMDALINELEKIRSGLGSSGWECLDSEGSDESRKKPAFYFKVFAVVIPAILSLMLLLLTFNSFLKGAEIKDSPSGAIKSTHKNRETLSDELKWTASLNEPVYKDGQLEICAIYITRSELLPFRDKKIHTLKLWLCTLEPSVLREIASMHGLRVVQLAGCQDLMDKDLRILLFDASGKPNFSNLLFLDISGTGASNKLLADFRRLDRLESLRIGGPSVNDRSLEILKELPLRALVINEGDFSKKSLSTLKSMGNLRWLRLPAKGIFTDDDLIAIEGQMHSCKVSFDDSGFVSRGSSIPDFMTEP